MIPRRLLDAVYAGCGAIAALFMLAIAILVLTSIGTRLAGIQAPGLADYAGYCMAASSFFALAYTFGHAGHIRVKLVLERLGTRKRRAAEVWCHGVGFLLAAYFAWYSISMVRVSIKINDISQGPDATPLWIPQLAMAIGTTILAVALLDRLIAIVAGADVDAQPQS